MGIKYDKPFISTRLQEERDLDTHRVLSLRLNQEEVAELERLKDLMDTQNDGRVIKILMRLGYDRLHEVLSDEDLKWLSRRDRSRTFGPKGE